MARQSGQSSTPSLELLSIKRTNKYLSERVRQLEIELMHRRVTEIETVSDEEYAAMLYACKIAKTLGFPEKMDR